jgi:hypothetical protein
MRVSTQIASSMVKYGEAGAQVPPDSAMPDLALGQQSRTRAFLDPL